MIASFSREVRSNWAHFHEVQDGASFFRDAPASFHPLDELLREDVEVGHTTSQSPGALGPVPTTRRQNGDVTLELPLARTRPDSSPGSLRTVTWKFTSATNHLR